MGGQEAEVDVENIVAAAEQVKSRCSGGLSGIETARVADASGERSGRAGEIAPRVGAEVIVDDRL